MKLRAVGQRIVVGVAAGTLASALSGAVGLSPAAATTVIVTCPTDDLQTAIDHAISGSTVLVRGTCNGQFTITKNLTLVGSPATLDGGESGRVLQVDAGVRATIDFVTIQHGDVIGSGGGVLNEGILTLNTSQVSNNTATFKSAGGIANVGTLTLNSSQVTNNIADVDGGGIFNGGGSTLILNASQVSNNTAPSDGGGILNSGTMTLNLSTVYNNTANFAGGGIFNGGTLTGNVSRVSNNTAPRRGGGIFNEFGSVTLRVSVVSNNQASVDGGGILNLPGSVALLASVVSTNTPDNCAPPNSVPRCPPP